MTNTEKSGRETLNQWYNDPAKWKRVRLYYNKNNKPVFPPKRSKSGWTINFAEPLPILSSLLILAIVILLTRLIF